jgi:predicted esterase
LHAPQAILLHGYGGDEKVMWVFAGVLPASWTVVSLRGVAPAPDGGFRWHVGRRWPPPEAAVFDPAVQALGRAVPAGRRLVWIGFSQGAALALCCAAAGWPTLGVASLSGYLPAGLPRLPSRLPVFWSHGRRDASVPIQAAHAAADQLRAWHARLEFCESDGGHKVGAPCLRSLRTWMAELERLS